MSQSLNTTLSQVKDPAVKEVLTNILYRLDRINNLPPVKEDLTQLAIAVNKITGKL